MARKKSVQTFWLKSWLNATCILHWVSKVCPQITNYLGQYVFAFHPWSWKQNCIAHLIFLWQQLNTYQLNRFTKNVNSLPISNYVGHLITNILFDILLILVVLAGCRSGACIGWLKLATPLNNIWNQ